MAALGKWSVTDMDLKPRPVPTEIEPMLKHRLTPMIFWEYLIGVLKIVANQNADSVHRSLGVEVTDTFMILFTQTSSWCLLTHGYWDTKVNIPCCKTIYAGH